jgi:transposase-like protein
VKTIQQIAKDFDIHPVQVSEWKKTMAGTEKANSHSAKR